MKNRKAGILMPISSLPAPYGIGTLGKCAYAFADRLNELGVKIWQVLPLLPTNYGDSPYQSCSSNALNYYFIDFELLKEEGLLSIEDYEAVEWGKEPCRVDYGKMFENKIPVLKKAFARFDKTSDEWSEFLKKGEYLDFAVFMTLKTENGHRAWNDWDYLKTYDEEKVRLYADKRQNDIEFWQFTQYVFLKQWTALKNYCNQKNIEIMGDMPIYVAYDSVEMWKYKNDLFLLNEDGEPSLVAGVPPDAFSDDGQLWGNPVYNWKKMADNGFSWWIDRIEYALKLFDIVRIDHFRGFDRFYAIKAGEENAKNGEWMDGPKFSLFESLKDKNIVAEDLGVIDDGVIKLMKDTGYPGMKVIEFAFDGNENNEHKPSNYTENFVAYTGTHDNEPLYSYIKGKSEWEKAVFDADLKKECELLGVEVDLSTDKNRVNGVIDLLFASVAATVIVPMQDILALDKEARINFPSTVSPDNWSYRFLEEDFTKAFDERVKTLIENSHRN